MKIENTRVYGIENAISVSKFPMATDVSKCDEYLGKNTAKLSSCKPGTGHDQFTHGIIVQFNLTASNKFWTEAQRYHWLEFISSQSTMHKITQFDIKQQCNRYVDEFIVERLQTLVNDYNNIEDKSTDEAKEAYLKVLYNIPSGFQLTAGMTTNYCQLKTIYHQRRHHRLPEWKVFCKWIEELPRFKELMLGMEDCYE
ncbi:hypothetical protein [Konateibacter massiliensis]|uniref:hypothetical protein n=1 Tax=Konateibacter massiliensis TaxID=2002841 RepID=UPI000C15393B|nr:hypothetical protein [Konateibacter massiliensis]